MFFKETIIQNFFFCKKRIVNDLKNVRAETKVSWESRDKSMESFIHGGRSGKAMERVRHEDVGLQMEGHGDNDDDWREWVVTTSRQGRGRQGLKVGLVGQSGRLTSGPMCLVLHLGHLLVGPVLWSNCHCCVVVAKIQCISKCSFYTYFFLKKIWHDFFFQNTLQMQAFIYMRACLPL